MPFQGFPADADLIPWSEVVYLETKKKCITFLKEGNFNVLN